MPKINEMLIIRGFQYAKSPDLNLSYYHILLIKNACNVCTIILPWGKYGFKIISFDSIRYFPRILF